MQLIIKKGLTRETMAASDSPLGRDDLAGYGGLNVHLILLPREDRLELGCPRLSSLVRVRPRYDHWHDKASVLLVRVKTKSSRRVLT